MCNSWLVGQNFTPTRIFNKKKGEGAGDIATGHRFKSYRRRFYQTNAFSTFARAQQ